MMESLSLEEENIIKDIRNLFRLKKELNYTAINLIHIKIDIKEFRIDERWSEFVYNYVNLLYYKCHKINLNRGASYIDSPD